MSKKKKKLNKKKRKKKKFNKLTINIIFIFFLNEKLQNF